LAGTVDHCAVAVRLDIVVRGAPGADLDPVHTNEHDVEVEHGEACFGQRPR
jgi:hypothetical protein